MGAKTKEIGGGPTVGLAEDFVSSLQQLLNGGGIGTAGSPDAGGSTGSIMGILADLLSPGAGRAGGSIKQLLDKQTERDVNAIRSRFGASGGTAFGTPAQHAESLFRAEAAPRITQAISGLQLQALFPLLQQIGQFSSMGIAPRQLVQQKGFLGEALGTVAGVAGAALPFIGNPFGGGQSDFERKISNESIG